MPAGVACSTSRSRLPATPPTATGWPGVRYRRPAEPPVPARRPRRRRSDRGGSDEYSLAYDVTVAASNATGTVTLRPFTLAPHAPPTDGRHQQHRQHRDRGPARRAFENSVPAATAEPRVQQSSSSRRSRCRRRRTSTPCTSTPRRPQHEHGQLRHAERATSSTRQPTGDTVYSLPEGNGLTFTFDATTGKLIALLVPSSTRPTSSRTTSTTCRPTTVTAAADTAGTGTAGGNRPRRRTRRPAVA